jgi:hypothetical protein
MFYGCPFLGTWLKTFWNILDENPEIFSENSYSEKVVTVKKYFDEEKIFN